MNQPQELTEEERAFEASFADTNAEPVNTASVEQPTQTSPAPAPAAADGGQGKDATPADDTQEDDPFAGYSPKVRELFADVVRQRQELDTLRRTAGMVPALQREIAQLKTATRPATPSAPPAPSPRFERVAALREQGLPEIADALEELAAALPKQVTKEPEPPPEPPADPEVSAAAAEAAAAELAQAEQKLNERRPNWAREMVSHDFLLWLSQQPFRQEVETTRKPEVVQEALQRWDHWRARQPQPSQPQPQRTSRMRAAINPRGDGNRNRATATNEEEAAFMAGWNNA